MENTKNKYSNLEVLSPAGNAESFYAAINNGADAIYLGLSDFNARMRADNFTVDNIREFVKQAHLFGVKIYVTINTLLKDEDFERLIDMVKNLVDAKVDAFIIQDFGVAHVLKNSFKNINLHASTQMGIHNLNGAKVAEKLGFSRIVLSRETTLEDIKLIKENTNLEIEYFVQGALCVAFSGNCYLSALEHGKSGNEGKCLQLCRLPYTNNLDGKTQYYLSTRDLCLIDNLQELINAGVSSFKIEGRLRHAGYVATATNIYKSIIKQIKSNKIDKKPLNEYEEDLKISYSRGDFNKNAYLSTSFKNEIIFPEYQNHIGEKIGTVKSVQPFKNNLYKVTIESSHALNLGDGIKIINSKTKTQIASLGVGNFDKINSTTYVIYTKNNFPSGLDVHLTQNSSKEQSLLNQKKKIKLRIKITANKNEPLIVVAENDFASIQYQSNEILEPAKSQALTTDDFFNQFNKLSDTSFEIENFNVSTNNVFIPKSLLNSARRKVIELITEKTVLENEKHISAHFDENQYQNVKKSLIKTNPYNLVINSFKLNANEICVFKPSDYTNINYAELSQKTNFQNFALSLPVITNSKDQQLIDNILTKLPKDIYLYTSNIGGLIYAEQGYKIIASPLLNIKNKYAIKCLNMLGITTICASIESSIEFAKSNNLIWFQKGYFPLMTFAHCPFKAVTNSTCLNCKHTNNLSYTSQSNTSYPIKRTKLCKCYFSLNKSLNREITQFNIINFED